MIADLKKLAMNAKEASSVAEAAAKCREPILEPKLDGIRLLVHIREDGVRAYSRAGNDNSGKLPLIDAELVKVFPAGTWLDAEAVEFNDDGSQNWGGAQSVMGSGQAKAAAASGNMRLVVFDILSYGDNDARGAALKVRRELLKKIFEDNASLLGRVMLTCQMEATQANHDAIVAQGYEGTMIKDLTAPYSSGKRGWAWIKIKLVETTDVVVTGFTEGTGKRAAFFGAIVFGQYLEDGTFIEDRGKCSGMTDAQLEEIHNNRERYLGTVIEISYRTFMVDKKTGLPNYRHPQFERFRWDKEATECTIEEAA